MSKFHHLAKENKIGQFSSTKSKLLTKLCLYILLSIILYIYTATLMGYAHIVFLYIKIIYIITSTFKALNRDAQRKNFLNVHQLLKYQNYRFWL